MKKTLGNAYLKALQCLENNVSPYGLKSFGGVLLTGQLFHNDKYACGCEMSGYPSLM